MTDLDKGMENLRKGSLMYLLAVAVSLASIIPIAALSFTEGELIDPALFASLGALAILIGVAIVLGIASFVYLFMATGALRKVNEKYGIGRKGVLLILLGLISLSFSLIPVLFAVASGEIASLNVGIIGLLFSIVLLLIGAILFGIMLLELEDVDSRFKTAGIIYIIGIIVPFLIIVAMILVYSAASRVIKGTRAAV